MSERHSFSKTMLSVSKVVTDDRLQVPALLGAETPRKRSRVTARRPKLTKLLPECLVPP